MVLLSKVTMSISKVKNTPQSSRQLRKKRRLLRPKKLQKRNRRESIKNSIQTLLKQTTNWLEILKTRTFMEMMKMTKIIMKLKLVAKTLMRAYSLTLVLQIVCNLKRRWISSLLRKRHQTRQMLSQNRSNHLDFLEILGICLFIAILLYRSNSL